MNRCGSFFKPLMWSMALLLAAFAAGCGGGGGGSGGSGGGGGAGSAGTLTLTTDSPTITEPATGTKAMTFTLTLNLAPTVAVTLDYATLTTGTATSGVDFVAVTAGTVNFAVGQTVATASITVNSDATAEGDETVLVKFSGTSLVADVTGTGTILANDTTGVTAALTTGVDTTASLGLAGNDDTVTGTIVQATPANGTLQGTDIFNGGAGTDRLELTPTVAEALTLDDGLFAGVTGFDKVVINTTTTGAQTITGARPNLYGTVFGAAGVDLETTSSTGAMTINTSSFTGATILAATSTTGAQTITTGTGVTTVKSIATTGTRTITSSDAVVARVTLTSGDSTGGNTITTGTGNDTITITASGTANSTLGNTITAGTRADTITLATDASIDVVVIANADSGITVATADSITNFTAANDNLKMGLAATGANYVEAGVAVADFAAALTAANIALNGTVLYSFEFDATNGYLFKDTDGDGTADLVVVLVGITNAGIAFADIIA